MERNTVAFVTNTAANMITKFNWLCSNTKQDIIASFSHIAVIQRFY
jgi:hypothetical protein